MGASVRAGRPRQPPAPARLALPARARPRPRARPGLACGGGGRCACYQHLYEVSCEGCFLVGSLGMSADDDMRAEP